MNDDLKLPPFLDRKLNPVVEDRKAGQLKAVEKDGLVWPPARDWKEVAREARAENAPTIDDLTTGELDELAEIKAMAKTNEILARSMSTDWLGRTSDRKALARRRAALRSVKWR